MKTKTSENTINKILDKINKVGLENVSFDERNYLNQYNNSKIDVDLENWLNSEEEHTLDYDENKLLYNEFEDDEDIFYHHEKLKRVISNVLNNKPFTNNADWGGACVWGVKTDDNFTGLFIYLGDDDLVLLKRNINEEENYEDDILKTITNNKDLNSVFLEIKHLSPK